MSTEHVRTCSSIELGMNPICCPIARKRLGLKAGPSIHRKMTWCKDWTPTHGQGSNVLVGTGPSCRIGVNTAGGCWEFQVRAVKFAQLTTLKRTTRCSTCVKSSVLTWTSKGSNKTNKNTGSAPNPVSQELSYIYICIVISYDFKEKAVHILHLYRVFTWTCRLAALYQLRQPFRCATQIVFQHKTRRLQVTPQR